MIWDGWINVDNGWMLLTCLMDSKRGRTRLVLTQPSYLYPMSSRIGVRKKKLFFPSLVHLPTAQPWWGSQLCPTTFFTAPLKALFCIFGIITSRNTNTGYWKTDATWIGQLMGCVQKFCETLDTVPIATMMGSLFLILPWQPTTAILLLHHYIPIPSCQSPLTCDDAYDVWSNRRSGFGTRVILL